MSAPTPRMQSRNYLRRVKAAMNPPASAPLVCLPTMPRSNNSTKAQSSNSCASNWNTWSSRPLTWLARVLPCCAMKSVDAPPFSWIHCASSTCSRTSSVVPFEIERETVSRLDRLVEFRDPLGPAAKQFLPRLQSAFLVEQSAVAERLARENPAYSFVTPDESNT